MNPELKYLRYSRTAASNRALSTLRSCLDDPAPYVMPDGLPSWWPFWSDVLKRNVREAVRAARKLEETAARLGVTPL